MRIRGTKAAGPSKPGWGRAASEAVSLAALAAWFAISCSLWAVPGPTQGAAEAGAELVRHFRAGQEALQAGRADVAAEEFRKVLKLQPGLVEARANLGLAYYLLGEYERTVAELSAVTRQQPNVVAANLFLGLGYLKLGQPDRAIAPLERVLSQDPSNREARRGLASAHLAEEDYGAAAKEFRALFSHEGDKAEAWYLLGRDYLQISSHLVARMVSEYRESAWMHRLAGDVLALRDFWNDAVGEYRKALEADPQQAGLQASLGMAFLRLEKLTAAETAFLAELQHDPNNEQSLVGMAALSLRRGDTESALQWAEKLSNLGPDVFNVLGDMPVADLPPEQASALIAKLQATPASRPVHLLLANVHHAAGEMEKAEEHSRAFQAAPGPDGAPLPKGGGSGRAEQYCRSRRYAVCAELLSSKGRLQAGEYLLLGKARVALGEDEKAAEALSRALALEKANIEVMYWLVGTHQRLAEECFHHLEETFPHSWRVHQMRGEGQKIRQAYDEAIEEFRLALSLRANEPGLYEAVGHAYLMKNSLDDAKPELEKALELDPSRARSLFLLGHLYLKRREEEKAIPYLQKALRREPDLLEARASLGTAYRRLGQAALAVPELEKAASQDFYGDLHYQLSLAYRQLGKEELARQALARSQELRRSSVAYQQARIAGAIEIEGD